MSPDISEPSNLSSEDVIDAKSVKRLPATSKRHRPATQTMVFGWQK
jgi:hypothetical protein